MKFVQVKGSELQALQSVASSWLPQSPEVRIKNEQKCRGVGQSKICFLKSAMERSEDERAGLVFK